MLGCRSADNLLGTVTVLRSSVENEEEPAGAMVVEAVEEVDAKEMVSGQFWDSG